MEPAGVSAADVGATKSDWGVKELEAASELAPSACMGSLTPASLLGMSNSRWAWLAAAWSINVLTNGDRK
jgi:hypothetical protein